ncbi:MAG TPA: hypothetical protein VFF73_05900 [Planctomycetota bacterium]|nr:hypothetical protein [Planctomycetota bacterium]
MKRAFIALALVAAAALADDGKSLKELLEECRRNDATAARKAADEVLARFVDSPELESATDPLSRAWYFEHHDLAPVESGLRTIIAKSPHRNVRARAMLDLRSGSSRSFEAKK